MCSCHLIATILPGVGWDFLFLPTVSSKLPHHKSRDVVNVARYKGMMDTLIFDVRSNIDDTIRSYPHYSEKILYKGVLSKNEFF